VLGRVELLAHPGIVQHFPANKKQKAPRRSGLFDETFDYASASAAQGSFASLRMTS
jgi:hypothetical protein